MPKVSDKQIALNPWIQPFLQQKTTKDGKPYQFVSLNDLQGRTLLEPEKGKRGRPKKEKPVGEPEPVKSDKPKGTAGRKKKEEGAPVKKRQAYNFTMTPVDGGKVQCGICGGKFKKATVSVHIKSTKHVKASAAKGVDVYGNPLGGGEPVAEKPKETNPFRLMIEEEEKGKEAAKEKEPMAEPKKRGRPKKEVAEGEAGPAPKKDVKKRQAYNFTMEPTGEGKVVCGICGGKFKKATVSVHIKSKKHINAAARRELDVYGNPLRETEKAPEAPATIPKPTRDAPPPPPTRPPKPTRPAPLPPTAKPPKPTRAAPPPPTKAKQKPVAQKAIPVKTGAQRKAPAVEGQYEVIESKTIEDKRKKAILTKTGIAQRKAPAVEGKYEVIESKTVEDKKKKAVESIQSFIRSKVKKPEIQKIVVLPRIERVVDEAVIKLRKEQRKLEPPEIISEALQKLLDDTPALKSAYEWRKAFEDYIKDVEAGIIDIRKPDIPKTEAQKFKPRKVEKVNPNITPEGYQPLPKRGKPAKTDMEYFEELQRQKETPEYKKRVEDIEAEAMRKVKMEKEQAKRDAAATKAMLEEHAAKGIKRTKTIKVADNAEIPVPAPVMKNTTGGAPEPPAARSFENAPRKSMAQRARERQEAERIALRSQTPRQPPPPQQRPQPVKIKLITENPFLQQLPVGTSRINTGRPYEDDPRDRGRAPFIVNVRRFVNR